MQTLQKIREMFAAKTDSIPCPQCKSPLTIGKTPFFETIVCESCLQYACVNNIEQCCLQEDIHLVKHQISGGFQIRKQCKSCGYIRGQAIGQLTQEVKDKLPLSDLKAREEYDIRRRQMVRDFYDGVGKLKLVRNESAIEDRRELYREYLKTPEWQKKRMSVLKRDQYLCQSCLEGYATQVHHKSYQFVDLKGSEPAFDLVAICVPCHNKIEGMKKEQRKIQ